MRWDGTKPYLCKTFYLASYNNRSSDYLCNQGVCAFFYYTSQTGSLRSVCIIWTTYNCLILLQKWHTEQLIGRLWCKRLLRCCFVGSSGTYCFKGIFLTLFFFSPAAFANYFASEILCCITVYHASAFWVFLKVYSLFHLEAFPFTHCGKPSCINMCIWRKEGEKVSTCCCSRGVHSSARGHMNICHAFPYLLARTYFSIFLILLLCDCQI